MEKIRGYFRKKFIKFLQKYMKVTVCARKLPFSVCEGNHLEITVKVLMAGEQICMDRETVDLDIRLV